MVTVEFTEAEADAVLAIIEIAAPHIHNRRLSKNAIASAFVRVLEAKGEEVTNVRS